MERHITFNLPEDFTKDKEVLIHKAEIQGEFLKVTYEEKDKLSDGDFFTIDGCIGIFRGKGPTPDIDLIPFYVGWTKGDDKICICKEEEYSYSGFGHFSENYRKATLEEIALFKRKLAANGYIWNSKSKKLERFIPKDSIIVHNQKGFNTYYFLKESLSSISNQAEIYASLDDRFGARVLLGDKILYNPDFISKVRLANAKEVLDFFKRIKKQTNLTWDPERKEFIWIPNKSEGYYYINENFEISSREYKGDNDALSHLHTIQRNMFKTYKSADKARGEILRCLRTFNGQ
jgi:hypothetical protein